MAAFARGSEIPNLRILVQTRDRIVTYETPSPPSIELPKKAGTNDFDVTPETIASTAVPCALTDFPVVVPAAPRLTPFFDPTGRFLCVVPHNHNIVIIDTKNPDLRFEIPNTDVQSAYFSPLGGFLLTWSLPSTAAKSGEGNFRLWSTANV